MDRHIDFDGIDNFRDFGGYATACGRGLKRRVLFRSANHARATEADLARMAELGIAVVVDLRRTHERAREPSRRHERFAAQVLENDLGLQDDPWGHSLRGVEPTAEWFRQDAMTFYRVAPFEDAYLDLFGRYFRALAAADGAVLVHCAAGKDRTGMLCALTHHIAGVHPDDIVADYLLTNDEARIERRMPRFAALVQELSGHAPADAVVRTALSVEPAYLEAAFAEMRARYGSLDGYLEQGLGVGAADRQAIQDKVLG
jgi:protein-tyrosine phosphatase